MEFLDSLAESVTLDTRVRLNVFLGKDTDPLSDFQRFSKKLKNHC